MPEAEEAIPELCGKLLEVCTSKSKSEVNGNSSRVLSRKVFIFGWKEGVSTPSRNTFNAPRPGLYFKVVVVAASLRVNEIDGFAGI